jgi:hypothetical protein
MSRVRYWHVLLVVVLAAGGIWLLPSVTPPSPKPFLRSVVSQRPKNHSGSTRTSTWKLEGFGLKQIIARLVVFVNGEPHGSMDCVYNFAGLTEEVSGELLLVIQNGSSFGQANKFAPWIGLTVDPRTMCSFSHGSAPQSFEVSSALERCTSFNGSSGEVPGSDIVFRETLGTLQQGILSVDSLEESLKRLSSDKRVAYAVILEWK